MGHLLALQAEAGGGDGERFFREGTFAVWALRVAAAAGAYRGALLLAEAGVHGRRMSEENALPDGPFAKEPTAHLCDAAARLKQQHAADSRARDDHGSDSDSWGSDDDDGSAANAADDDEEEPARMGRLAEGPLPSVVTQPDPDVARIISAGVDGVPQRRRLSSRPVPLRRAARQQAAAPAHQPRARA